MNPRDVAKDVGIPPAVYRAAKTVVRAADCPGLSAEDRATTQEALRLLAAGDVRQAELMARPVFQRMFGLRTAPRTGAARVLGRRRDGFDRVVGVLVQAVGGLNQLPLPPLNKAQAQDALGELRGIHRALGAFIRKLEKANAND